LAFDRAGNLFEADQNSGEIIKFLQGGGGYVFAEGMIYPTSLAFNKSGTLYEGDLTHYGGQGFIHSYTPGGVQSTFASLVNPYALAVDGAGDVFQSDNGVIYKYLPSGEQGILASGFVNPDGMTIDGAGNLFVSDSYYGTVYKVTPTGVRSIFATGMPDPVGLAFDNAGNLFVADGSGDIYKITPDGTRSTFATGLIQPNGLAFQPIPEPSVFGMSAAGAAAFLVSQRRRTLIRS
jgi:hypothetical protein